MIQSAIAAKLKRRSKNDFKGRHFEAELIVQAELLERGLEVDHSTVNCRVLAYAPLIERRLRSFRKPHCGSMRVDETYVRPETRGMLWMHNGFSLPVRGPSSSRT